MEDMAEWRSTRKMLFDRTHVEFVDYVQVMVLLFPCLVYFCCSDGQECLLLRKTYDLDARARHVSHKNNHITIYNFVSYSIKYC